jgi:outer membrane protein assembly factor BamE
MLMLRFGLVQLSALLLSACFLAPHKVPVPQGNIVELKNVEQLQVGMTKSQVLFLLGNPLINDPFHPDRWDYFNHRNFNDREEKPKRLTLYFQGDQLAKIEHTGDLSAVEKDADDALEETRKD